MSAVAVGCAIYLLIASVRPIPLSDRVEPHLTIHKDPVARRSRTFPRTTAFEVVVGAAVGAALGPVSWVFGAVGGAIVGPTIGGGVRRRRRRARSRRLGFELPAMADLLALYIRAGESVLGSIEHVVRETVGVGSEELAVALGDAAGGSDLSSALETAARDSDHLDASRLYQVLAQAHRSGARLVDALEIFSADRRASLARDMIEEGGRRAITGYGPILGLMIPTTLAFLLYPTLAGLDALAITQ